MKKDTEINLLKEKIKDLELRYTILKANSSSTLSSTITELKKCNIKSS